MLRRLCAELLDRADYLFTVARLTVLDWLAPPRETPLIEQSARKENVSEKRSPRSISIIRDREHRDGTALGDDEVRGAFPCLATADPRHRSAASGRVSERATGPTALRD
jgi:hypothetical protein